MFQLRINKKLLRKQQDWLARYAAVPDTADIATGILGILAAISDEIARQKPELDNGIHEVYCQCKQCRNDRKILRFAGDDD